MGYTSMLIVEWTVWSRSEEPAVPTEVPRGFLRSLQINAAIVPRLGYYPKSFTIHLLSYHYKLHNLSLLTAPLNKLELEKYVCVFFEEYSVELCRPVVFNLGYAKTS
jgi:hypothetical protein